MESSGIWAFVASGSFSFNMSMRLFVVQKKKGEEIKEIRAVCEGNNNYLSSLDCVFFLNFPCKIGP